MTEKIPYWKSNRFLGSFVWKNGEDGCVICEEDGDSISMDKPPPPLRDQAPPPKPDIVEKKPAIEKSDPWKNLAIAVIDGIDGVRRLKQWAATPPAPASPELPGAKSALNEMVHKKKISFDIQQIPATIRKLGAPKGAKMLEKWFEGELNYSPTKAAAKAGLNQNGSAFPPSMVDKKSISMKWVLSFERAERAFKQLMQKDVYTQNAHEQIAKSLGPFKNRSAINAYEESCADIARLHCDFQFQRATVEESWEEKLEQYLSQAVSHRGIPDDLTFTLGAFNIYAAIGNAYFVAVTGGKLAYVTSIYLYVKDSFNFNDFEGKRSQYLGHWSAAGVAVVPVAALGVGSWALNPILPQALIKNETPMYPVRNVDFRQWRARHGQGGDFLIYSDMVHRRLSTPIKVRLAD